MTTNSRKAAAEGNLKNELGIVESLDGSPHRFFDWERDKLGDGAADSDSFMTIE